VWFADATLLLFPVASYSHQFLWITCPLWLSRWNRWLENDELGTLIKEWRSLLTKEKEDGGKTAIAFASDKDIYLQGALLNSEEIEPLKKDDNCWKFFDKIPDSSGLLDLQQKLVILSNDDCAALVETGLQREVRVALKEGEKTVDGGSFRSEEAIPSETVLFFPWGLKPSKNEEKTKNTQPVRDSLVKTLNSRIQFGGLEGLGRGWTENNSVEINEKTGD
jgi:CRISPR-associated protein Cmr4